MSGQRITEQHTHQMVVIHRIFRRGFPELAGVAREAGSADPQRLKAIRDYAEFLLGGLHHHHEAEDRNIWPRLATVTASDTELVERMEGQHAAVAQHIAAAQKLLDTWDDAADGEALAGELEALDAVLVPHLDEEEERILPLIREHLDLAVWEKTGDEAFAGFTNSEKLIALGQMLDVATPDEAAIFLEGLPFPIRVIWRVSGRRRYTRFMQQALGEAS